MFLTPLDGGVARGRRLALGILGDAGVGLEVRRDGCLAAGLLLVIGVLRTNTQSHCCTYLETRTFELIYTNIYIVVDVGAVP